MYNYGFRGCVVPHSQIQKDPLLARERHVLDRLRLASIPGLGPILRRRLIGRFGSASRVFQESTSSLESLHGVGHRLASAISTSSTHDEASRILDDCRRHGIAIILDTDPAFPELLSQIPDPPDMLFVRGTLDYCDGLAIAIVGARHATKAGLQIAHTFAEGLAHAGLTIVSGLARGIDAAAHRGAINAGGRTIAVLGSGLRNIYPREHQHLVEEVICHGAAVSELPPITPPQASAFPRRNRIVSGLSLGTVVIQASQRSGALITARLAGEHGRDVFALPGPVDCRMSAGCHSLIRDGVTLVTCIDEILDELGPLHKKVRALDGRAIHKPAELQLDEFEQSVLAAIDATSDPTKKTTIDAVVEHMNIHPSRILAACAAFEIRRIIIRLPGNIIQRR